MNNARREKEGMVKTILSDQNETGKDIFFQMK